MRKNDSKILIVGNQMCGWMPKIADLCRNIGYESDVLMRDDHDPVLRNIFDKVFNIVDNKFFGANIKRHTEGKKRLGKDVLDWAKKNHGGIILEFVGDNLLADELKDISQHAVIIKKMADSVEEFPAFRKILKYYDAVYTYETRHIPEIEKYTRNKAVFLPASYLDNVYHPIQAKKVNDISFVGTMIGPDSIRRKFLQRLIADNRDLKFAFYGAYASRFKLKSYINWVLYDRGKCFRNTNIGIEEVNKVYNTTKINVCLNSWQTFDTWSSRLVELLGAGAFVIAQYTPLKEKIFKDGIVLFKTYEELNEKVRYYLDHPDERDKIAKKGHEIAVKKFTATHMLEVLIEDAKQIQKVKFADVF